MRELSGNSAGTVPPNSETTDQLGMLLRDWRALQWAKTLPEWNGKDVAVAGGSMGGYQALAMAALDPGVTSGSRYDIMS